MNDGRQLNSRSDSMPTAELYVVTYTPLAHSMSHWAIYLRIIPTDVDPDDDGGCQHFIYQANGPEGNLALNVAEANPRHSRRCREVIMVSSIDDIEEVKTKLREQPMSNEVASWSCQDWVMEALETLDDEELLDSSTYAEAKTRLDELFNE